jgi:spermidine/putrescine transport system ATP-binding protein
MTERSSIISIKGVSKRFGNVVTAVDDVSLDIREGEFFALLGPSGCGKTTLLRMLAGFEILSEGTITIDGQNMEGVDPNRRPVNMVFQSYAVFPHMSVFDNVAYGLKVTGVAKDEIRARVEEALGLVRLDGFGGRKPDQLSGGQRQRVALARALVKRPRVLLLDEPLSALDAKLRAAMQLELVRLQHTVGITFIIVTHDQDEALSMADRVAVMEAGRVRQIAPPSELYEYPANRFVADFIGKMNLFEGQVRSCRDGVLEVAISGLGDLEIPHDGEALGEVGIAIRPEKLRVTQEQPGESCVCFAAVLDNIAYHGSESHMFFTTDLGAKLTATVQNETRTREPVVEGERLWVSWIPGDTLVLAE